MSNLLFSNYLKTLGFSTTQKGVEDSFVYNIPLDKTNTQEISVPFYYIKRDNGKKLFKIHQKLWNRNQTNFFIVVRNNETLVFNAKVKPRLHNLDLGKIAAYPFGVSNTFFANHLSTLTKESKNLFSNILSKENFDTGNFFRFFIAKRKKNRENEVDKDLLLNLIALKQDLEIIELQEKSLNEKKDSITHLLILRCLFLKYLEDRQVFRDKNLFKILNSGNAQLLINEFEKVKKINGDIFKDRIFTVSEIQPFLSKLGKFFSVFDYRSGQGSLFPYRFDEIPIQLLSNVYEAFLKKSEKKSKGIFYTPTFLVNFILSYSVEPILKNNPKASVFDPSCGSGAFLVESFRKIIKVQKAENSFELKKEILTKQIFGIDIDEKALQIATFSLYLALLEDINPEFIQEQIRIKSPILPSLIGKTLIGGNTLVEDVFENQTFDCIVGNPPWGSVNKKDKDGIITRKHIGGKGVLGINANYQYVADYQMSQAFLVRVKKWSNSATKFAMVVNNSIFFNEKSTDFVKYTLTTKYQINYFFELSKLNKILFRKRKIGEVGNEEIEIGATEPCCVLFFENKENENHHVNYVTPQLNSISEYLKLIHFIDRDLKFISQKDLQSGNWVWSVLVNSNKEGYQLIKRLSEEKSDIEVVCHSGFQPKKNMISLGENDFKELITIKDFRRFFIKEELSLFNWNQDLRRKPPISYFSNSRVLVPVRPLQSDNYRLRGVAVNREIIHKHEILAIKFSDKTYPINAYLGLMNSSLIGFILYQISSQWGKGDLKRSTLRNIDIEKLPVPKIDNKYLETLNNLVQEIIELNKSNLTAANQQIKNLEDKINEVVFDLYGLLDYEKEIIREFYKINVDRKDNPKVNILDLEKYVNKFKEVFEFILSEEIKINISYRISPNLGTILKFDFVPKTSSNKENILEPLENSDGSIISIIQKEQLTEAFYNNRLNETKTKVYSNDSFYIMKSNYFKDWTIRKAVQDANEEIGLIVQNLPK